MSNEKRFDTLDGLIGHIRRGVSEVSYLDNTEEQREEAEALQSLLEEVIGDSNGQIVIKYRNSRGTEEDNFNNLKELTTHYYDLTLKEKRFLLKCRMAHLSKGSWYITDVGGSQQSEYRNIFDIADVLNRIIEDEGLYNNLEDYLDLRDESVPKLLKTFQLLSIKDMNTFWNREGAEEVEGSLYRYWLYHIEYASVYVYSEIALTYGELKESFEVTKFLNMRKDGRRYRLDVLSLLEPNTFDNIALLRNDLYVDVEYKVFWREGKIKKLEENIVIKARLPLDNAVEGTDDKLLFMYSDGHFSIEVKSSSGKNAWYADDAEDYREAVRKLNEVIRNTKSANEQERNN